MRAGVVAICLGLVLSAGCDPNPKPEDVCTLGYNGGDPVIIVAGTFSPQIANELFLGNGLEAAGYTHCVYELRGDNSFGNLPGSAPIEVSALALAGFVGDVLDWAGETKVDLIGHSQGALVARQYVKFYGGQASVDALISLAGPNRGTESVAVIELFLGPILAPFGVTCDDVAPCNQMRLDSDLVTTLNAGDATPGSVDYYAFYTDNDALVWYWGTNIFGFPVIKYDNAELEDGATNVQIDDECPARYVSHLGMILDPVVLHMVKDALAGDPIDVPLLTCLLPPVPSPI